MKYIKNIDFTYDKLSCIINYVWCNDRIDIHKEKRHVKDGQEKGGISDGKGCSRCKLGR